MENILTARKAILEDLKRRYKEGDKTVTANPPWSRTGDNFFSGEGEMTCPVCKTGQLRYSREGHRGHVYGRCSTNNCVAWME